MPETVSVRKVNGLPRASFSRNLAVQALPLAMCLAPPPALRDFHPVEFAHAERTRKSASSENRSRAFESINDYLLRASARAVLKPLEVTEAPETLSINSLVREDGNGFAADSRGFMLIQNANRDNLSAISLNSNGDDTAHTSADTQFFTGLQLIKRSRFVGSESGLAAEDRFLRNIRLHYSSVGAGNAAEDQTFGDVAASAVFMRPNGAEFAGAVKVRNCAPIAAHNFSVLIAFRGA